MRPVGCFATENFLEEIAWNKRQHSWEVAIILGLQVCMAVPVYVTCMLTKELGRKKKKRASTHRVVLHFTKIFVLQTFSTTMDAF